VPFKKGGDLEIFEVLPSKKIITSICYSPLDVLQLFYNRNIFISLKIVVIFKVDKVIAPPCI